MSLSLLENWCNFIVHCPSNVKLEGSDGHKNTPSHFYVPLPQKIPLELNEWEVGLSEIFIPSYGYNMKPPLNSSIQVYGKGHTAAGSRKKHRIRIPEGRYYPKVYICALNEEIEHLEEGVRTRFRFDETSERVRIQVGSGEVVVIDNPRLRKMLGVKRGPTNFSNSRPGGKMTVVMPKRVDLNVNGTSMFVYTKRCGTQSRRGQSSSATATSPPRTGRGDGDAAQAVRQGSFLPSSSNHPGHDRNTPEQHIRR